MIPKISVIIPVYNIASYLKACLESVINQTLRDIEIIIINDGSSDQSKEIITNYCSIDSRIILIDKENQGVALARKDGLQIAKGEYIHYLDGDDFLELDAYELVYKEASNSNADLVFFRFLAVDEISRATKTIRGFKKEKISKIDLIKDALDNQYYSVWQFIHKKSLYNSNILYDDNLTYGEDAYLTIQLLYFSNKIAILDSKPLLYYLVRKNSVTNSRFSDSHFESQLRYPELIDLFLSDKPEYHLLQKEISSAKVQMYATLFSNGYLKNAHKISKNANKLITQYPELKNVAIIKQFSKLFHFYTLHYLLGKILTKYYKLKKKIK